MISLNQVNRRKFGRIYGLSVHGLRPWPKWPKAKLHHTHQQPVRPNEVTCAIRSAPNVFPLISDVRETFESLESRVSEVSVISRVYPFYDFNELCAAKSQLADDRSINNLPLRRFPRMHTRLFEVSEERLRFWSANQVICECSQELHWSGQTRYELHSMKSTAFSIVFSMVFSESIVVSHLYGINRSEFSIEPILLNLTESFVLKSTHWLNRTEHSGVVLIRGKMTAVANYEGESATWTWPLICLSWRDVSV